MSVASAQRHDSVSEISSDTSSRESPKKPTVVDSAPLTRTFRSGRYEAIAGQRPSIWSTYVRLADKHDKNMFKRWNSSMNTLLVFVRVVVPKPILP